MSYKIIHVHNFYLESGGEDTAFSAEVDLLRRNGQNIIEYLDHNQRIEAMNKVSVAAQTIWSWNSYDKLVKVLRREHPDVVHFHNTFPLISPSAYYACRKTGVPVIQSLDNPRLLCPSANFYRNGQLCQDCLGKTPAWPGIIHSCYHASPLQTAVVASMISLNRWIKTWESKIDIYLVATEFYRRKFIEGGLPSDKIVIMPHFIYPDPGIRPADRDGKYALFIGRLEPEKGVRTMLSAWKILKDIPLKIRGNGNLDYETAKFIHDNDLSGRVEIIGRLSEDELTETVKGARFLVWPSEGYYETFGYVAVESFSCGVPVIATRLGVPAEIVTDRVTGLHFNPGDQDDLAEKVRWAWENPDEMANMGLEARRIYELKYTAEKNYQALIDIYREVIDHYKRGK
jgi:glycosyltransferase involved in cell wall biosynthesis